MKSLKTEMKTISYPHPHTLTKLHLPLHLPSYELHLIRYAMHSYDLHTVGMEWHECAHRAGHSGDDECMPPKCGAVRGLHKVKWVFGVSDFYWSIL